jgi:peptidoglycan/xylan/chitin deacetylase (PgdA/CDA1 family)
MKTGLLPFYLATAMIALQCSSPGKNELLTKKVPVVLCFDVEDYTSPAEAGMDDIPKWLAEIMTEEGVTGSFFVIGEKARMMERRDRTDVIDAMAQHDIGSHTNFGSIHPTITEILEHAGWEDGTGRMMENEGSGIDDLGRIFGQRPVNLARHGGSYGPQLVASLGKLGAGYVYSPVSLPGHNAVWFCNTLNFHGEGDFGFFDDAYYRDDLFEPMLEALDSLIPANTKDMDVVAFFANHPSKIRSIQFWDFNYYYGANPGPEEWKTPELRPLESMETAKKNFRRLVRYLGDRDDIELTTFRDLYGRFSYQPDTISAARLERIARRILDERKVVIDDHYSPAEVFSTLCDAIVQYRDSGKIPGVLKVRRPLGPVDMPLREPETDLIPGSGIFQLADNARSASITTGHLPSHVDFQGSSIGTGSLLALFSNFYLSLRNTTVTGEDQVFTVIEMEPYPSLNEEQITSEVASYKGWPVHRKDLDMSGLVEMTRLQMWTLKPAITVKSEFR